MQWLYRTRRIRGVWGDSVGDYTFECGDIAFERPEQQIRHRESECDAQ